LLAYEDKNGRLVLIDGHLRASTTPECLVPVLVLDIDEKEAEKLLATFDPLAAMAELDTVAWTSLIDGIEFEVPEFGEFLEALNPRTIHSGLTDEDAAPPLPGKAITTTGDLWVLGEHRLLCGDATKHSDVKRLLKGVEPMLMVTDPPYGVN